MDLSSGRGLSRRRTAALLVLVSAALLGLAPRGAWAEQAKDEFPSNYYYPKPQVRALHRTLEGKPAPALSIKQWHGKPFDLGELKGKVVVVDFWGTWCGPCRASIPHNVKLINQHAKDGLIFLGVHDSKRGWNDVPSVAKSSKINYPVGLDDGGKSAKAWKVSFWPTYGVIDRKGTLRALGLTPNSVAAVVKKLLAEPAPADEKEQAKKGEKDDGAAAEGEVPQAWLEGSAKARSRLDSLLAAEAPPPLQVEKWINSKPIALSDLAGKVVLLDFWTPTRDASTNVMVRNNLLHENHKHQGLVVIGVCDSDAAARFAEVAAKLGIDYPLAIDVDGQTASAYGVDNRPDLYLIDRNGKLRIADVRDNAVDEAVAMLLAEEPAKTASSAE